MIIKRIVAKATVEMREVKLVFSADLRAEVDKRIDKLRDKYVVSVLDYRIKSRTVVIDGALPSVELTAIVFLSCELPRVRKAKGDVVESDSPYNPPLLFSGKMSRDGSGEQVVGIMAGVFGVPPGWSLAKGEGAVPFPLIVYSSDFGKYDRLWGV